MDEKDWRLIEMLSIEKSITGAAQRLYVTQPSLTYRIQQIEQMFGTKILIRRKTGIEFTAEGELIACYARQSLRELQKIIDRVANTGSNVRGILRLGVSSIFAHYRLPELLKVFLQHYPDVEINVKTGWSTEILQSVYREEVHIGIIRGDFQWPEHQHRLYFEPIHIVSKREVDLAVLPKLPRIQYKTDLPLKNMIDSWWQSTYKSLAPRTTMEVDNIQTCKELVKKDLGYAILPGICLQETDQLKIQPLRATDRKILYRNTWLICRDSLLELSAIRAFVDFSSNFNIDQNRTEGCESE
ncbi:LysR family transcriptional regulator [Ferroacidibacillus organovorans]|uniref:HTH lysR-type domain-containing protein n=1 Tax=Ferroacidibacillus organovorans TaxID=1765683 RepID=A0A117SXH0_9BACL|nr:LysR family transcriptional regulator [Ferroacidibacillus organovorans]KUO95406.1 hypothetical protein ATW55_11175 [Ferroacidibacillus organovorans]